MDELIKGTQYEEEIGLSLGLAKQLSSLPGKTIILLSDAFLINIFKKLSSQEEEEEKERR